MRNFCAFAVAAALALAAVSCGADHSDLPTGPEHPALAAPTGVTLAPGAEICRVSWSYPAAALPLVKEFRIYQYFTGYDIAELVGVTADTSFVDSFLVGNLYYCYEVSAVDSSDFEGWRTSPICAFVPTH